MKSNPSILAFMLLIFFASCTKEEDPKPDASYIGKLTLEYARDFPEFTATADMNVEIDKSGEVYISQPDQVQYSGEDEMNLDDALIKMNETGTITITSLDGTYKEMDGKGYLSVHASTLIDGDQKTWVYDEESGWILMATVPFSLDDPVESPMDFKIDDAAGNIEGAHLGADVQVPPFGSMTFTWTLGLAVALK